MLKHKTLAIIATLTSVAAAAAQTVSLTLSSPQNGQTVAPGATVDWTISFTTSTGDNAGLALLSTDLVQAAGNPELFDLSPASGVPAGMTNFSRPAGISNPGETNPATGYIGVLRGAAGARNVIQIGGGQNTFGVPRPGTGVGENANVVAGVGQSGAQTLASGSFVIPTTPGTYTFQLANAVANVMTQANTPPAFSPVVRATSTLAAGAITVTVGSNQTPADMNCDGTVDFFDIDPFVLALFDAPGYEAAYPNCNILNADTNGDGSVNFFDIDPFLTCLFQGCP